jgi:hypothetical protein
MDEIAITGIRAYGLVSWSAGRSAGSRRCNGRGEKQR